MTDDDRLTLESICRGDLFGDAARTAIRAALDEIGRLRDLIVDRECEAAEGECEDDEGVPPTLYQVVGEDSDHLAAYWRGKFEARGEAMDALGAEVRWLRGQLGACCAGGVACACDGK